MEKSIIAGHTGGGGKEPQGRQGKTPKLVFLKYFSKLKFSVSNNVGWGFHPNKNKEIQKSSSCHPELAAPLVADEKEAYKGGCSQSISGSSHRQKCVTICTVSGKEVLDKVGWAFSPTLKYCWGRNHNLQKAISYVSRKATRHVRGDLVPAFTLAEVFSPYYHSPRRVAFTLAEVLITLGIIGVVAAMTLPTLISNYQAKQRVTQLKKVYSVLNQAYLRVKEKYGSVESWGMSTTLTGEVDEDGNEIKDYTSASLFATRLAEFLNKSTFVKADESIGNVRTLDGREAFYPWIPKSDRYIRLADGTIIGVGWIENCSSATDLCTSAWVVFPKKQDMKLGVDVFNFELIPLKGFLPYGWDQMSGPLAGECSAKSSSLAASDADRACTAWALYNENMDYLKCDDLNWQTKKTCK